MSRQRPFLIVDNSDVQDAYDCLAVCVVSLEDVARITSQLGSEAAGAAHAEFASRLHSLLRREDQLIQIHEGKHCLVLRQLKDLNHAVLAGMKIERLFGEAVTVRGHPLHLKVRAGIACAEVGASDPEDLFRAAETAREAACALQTAFQLAEDDVVADMQHRWKLNDDVDGAIAEHHLKLYYQPKVSAVTHRLVGAEGLIRWESPEGLLTPNQFLPHLERDKMLAVTRHVVRQSVRDLAANPWLPSVAINLDPQTTEDLAVVPLLLDELALWNVDPRRLIVEVTEHGIVKNLSGMLTDFAQLRAEGVRIAMDDFGTGHSSLAQFRDLKLDELKIDRSFIFDLENQEQNRYLTGLVVDLGHYFDMTVVAEGVETRQTAELLRQVKCDTLQGFYFSPPLPLAEMFRWIEDRGGPEDCA